MTKKDYILIAQAIATAKNGIEHKKFSTQASMREHQAISDLVIILCDYLESKNPKFNRARFIVACNNYPDSVPCQKCGGTRDVEALICSKCSIR
jgi:hypothetical protein